MGDSAPQGRMYLVRAAQLPIDMQAVTGEDEAGADVKLAFTINTFLASSTEVTSADTQVPKATTWPVAVGAVLESETVFPETWKLIENEPVLETLLMQTRTLWPAE